MSRSCSDIIRGATARLRLHCTGMRMRPSTPSITSSELHNMTSQEAFRLTSCPPRAGLVVVPNRYRSKFCSAGELVVCS